MDDANYAIKVFSRHIKNAGSNSDPSDMYILELGPWGQFIHRTYFHLRMVQEAH